MPVFKYRDPNSGEWINVAGGGGGAANIPIQDEPPASGDLWVDTSEEGASGGSVDAYTKEETLSEETKTTFGLGADAVPNDAFSTIKSLIDAAVSTANSKAKIATGSYTGTGKYGSSNKNRLAFDFAPKFLVVAQNGNQTGYTSGGSFYWVYPSTGSVNITKANDSYTPSVSVSGNTVSWYTDAANTQLNISDTTYHYIAIG